MYARDSRYRDVPDVSRSDPSGRVLLVTDLRPRALAAGTFRHTVDANDRLDHLAQRYYRKPRKWWRISDANPEFASPLALLGQDPVATARVEVVAGAAQLPPWSELLRALRALVGVQDVGFTLEHRVMGGVAVQVGVAAVTFNQANLGPGELAAVAEYTGFPTGAPELVGRVGKPITIPPEGVS